MGIMGKVGSRYMKRDDQVCLPTCLKGHPQLSQNSVYTFFYGGGRQPLYLTLSSRSRLSVIPYTISYGGGVPAPLPFSRVTLPAALARLYVPLLPCSTPPLQLYCWGFVLSFRWWCAGSSAFPLVTHLLGQLNWVWRWSGGSSTACHPPVPTG